VVYTSYLLRRSFREGGKVRHETLGNLSHLPIEAIEAIRAILAGRVLVDPEDGFEVERSLPHGHVAAVLGVLRSLDLERLIGRGRCRERDLVVAMIVQQLIAPGSKLSATRRLAQTTLAGELELGEVKESELLAAMDWLLGRQDRIEKALARRHLAGSGFVLYDLSSSYVEGRCCPLAQLGYSRDGKKGKLQINYGLICSPEGRPVGVRVHEGKTQDQETVPDALETVRGRFGIENVVFVGDRGMITQSHAQALKDEGVGFISALKSGQIRALVQAGDLQLSLFDETNLAEKIGRASCRERV
jgi:Transposase